MNRRAFLGLLASGLLASSLSAGAQPAGKVWRIGFFSVGSPAPSTSAAFRQALQRHGYNEGQNILIVHRWEFGERDRLPNSATELAELNLDVIRLSVLAQLNLAIFEAGRVGG